MKFSELIKLLEDNGFKIVKEKGSIRYYGKSGWDKLLELIIMDQKRSHRHLSCYTKSSRYKKVKQRGVIYD